MAEIFKNTGQKILGHQPISNCVGREKKKNVCNLKLRKTINALQNQCFMKGLHLYFKNNSV